MTPHEALPLITRIWEEVLDLDGIEPGDDFFALGGDSLLAITMVSKARKAGLELTAAQVKEHPVLAQLVGSLS